MPGFNADGPHQGGDRTGQQMIQNLGKPELFGHKKAFLQP